MKQSELKKLVEENTAEIKGRALANIFEDKESCRHYKLD